MLTVMSSKPSEAKRSFTFEIALMAEVLPFIVKLVKSSVSLSMVTSHESGSNLHWSEKGQSASLSQACSKQIWRFSNGSDLNKD